MTDSQQDEQQGWKQKYYDAIGDLETREQQWAKVEQALRQGLNRISLAADDSDVELNRQLEKLRGDIRKGSPNESIQMQLSIISQSILRLDEVRKSQQPLSSPSELMSEIIGRIPFPRGMGHRSKALQKRLAKAKPEECDALGEEFSSLLGDTLAWAAGEQGDDSDNGEKKGLLGKLFNAREKGDATESSTATKDMDGLKLGKRLLAELIQTLVAEESSRNSLNDKVQASDQEVQLQQLSRELATMLRDLGDEGVEPDQSLPVNEVLVRLLERLDIPAELGDEVESVKTMLLQTLPAEEMEKVIVAIAEIIAEMRSRMLNEKVEIENFLKQLTSRLQEIDSGFQRNVMAQRESFDDGKALDSAVSAQVEGIEESVQQAEELAALKDLVQQRVDTIRNHMQEFRSAEEQRLAQAEQQVVELTQKLETVQGESEQLQQRLNDERNQAMVDPLIGIPNRLAYNERLAQELARWKRYSSPLVMAVWDIDKFKSVNDTYGHQAGDKVLTIVGKLLHQKIRETDFVARFGGEEFVLLLPQTTLDDALLAAEKLRKDVEATEFHFRGKRVGITISCGMSEFREGDSPEQVFERADKALYEAKNSGRNRCCQG